MIFPREHRQLLGAAPDPEQCEGVVQDGPRVAQRAQRSRRGEDRRARRTELRVGECLERDLAGGIGLRVRHDVPQIVRLAHALHHVRGVWIANLCGATIEDVRRQAVRLHERRVRVPERIGGQLLQRVEVDRVRVDRTTLVVELLAAGVVVERPDPIDVAAGIDETREGEHALGVLRVLQDSCERMSGAAPANSRGERGEVGYVFNGGGGLHLGGPLYCHSDNSHAVVIVKVSII